MRKCKLGKLLDVTRGVSLAGAYCVSEGDRVRLTLANFDYVNNCFQEDHGKDNLFYAKEVPKKFILGAGSIITPLTEQTPGLLGSTARIPESGKYIQSQDVGLITPFKDVLDHDFAYYLVSSKGVKNQLAVRSQQTKIRHTSPSKIKNCIVFVPDLPEQRKIGKFLSSIDRMIELSRKRIENLEKLAKEIYDYWFVQFDFPDKRGKPYKSSGGKMVYNAKLKREIPAGWSVVSLPIIADYLFGYAFDAKLFNEDGNGLKIVRIRNVKNGTTKDYTTEVAPSSYIVRNGDFLIGMDGYFDMNLWVGGDAYLVQRSCRVQTKDQRYQAYVRRFIAPLIKRLEQRLLGVTVAHLGKRHLDAFQIAVPDENLTALDLLNEYDSLIVKCGEQIVQLTQLREFLLPLLMNGQAEMR